ncbi:hypothetical protein ABKV19_013793, partial [Rosa sericea]
DALDWSDRETLTLVADIKDVVVDKLHECLRSFKYKMKKKWYKPYKGTEMRFICDNKHIHTGQLMVCVSKYVGRNKESGSCRDKCNKSTTIKVASDNWNKNLCSNAISM